MPHRVKDFPSLTWWRESIGSSIHKVLSRSYSNSAEAFPFAYRFSQFIWRAFTIHQRTFILSPSKAAKLHNYSTMDHCSRQWFAESVSIVTSEGRAFKLHPLGLCLSCVRCWWDWNTHWKVEAVLLCKWFVILLSLKEGQEIALGGKW